MCCANSSLPSSLILILFSIIVGSLALAQAQPDECAEPHRQLLAEYKAFHNANKHSPGATYLIQTCWRDHVCSGTGDRIRGTLWLLRVAVAYKKILLVDWMHPSPLTDYLLPHDIDWTFSGFDDPGAFHAESPLSKQDFFDAVYRQEPGALERFKAAKFYHTHDNPKADANEMVGITPLERKWDDGSCYFRFLFRPNPAIVIRADEYLTKLYGSPSVDYVAWHWRHGDADKGPEQPLMMSQLQSMMGCATRLAEAVGIDLNTRPALLITDYMVLRNMVVHGDFARLVSPNITAAHIDLGLAAAGRPDLAREAPATGIFTDLVLLARARCLLRSFSGFSDMALWMGGSRVLGCNAFAVAC